MFDLRLRNNRPMSDPGPTRTSVRSRTTSALPPERTSPNGIEQRRDLAGLVVLAAPRGFPEGLITKTAVLVSTAAFIARSLIFLSYFAACGGGGGLGSDVSIRIFHCPFSRTSRAVQITVTSRGSPFSLFPVILDSPVDIAMSSDRG